MARRPDDVVLYAVAKAGFMYRRDLALTHSDEEQVVTLDPELVISGRVTDAATGRPLPTFRVVRGLEFSNSPRIHWMVQDAAEFTDGRYTVKHSEPYTGYAIRVESAGYKPADSPVFRPGEATASFDFALPERSRRTSWPGSSSVPTADPRPGSRSALATPEHPLVFEMESYRFGRGNGMSFAKTGPDGRFSFGQPGGPYLLAAMGDDGYFEATPETLKNPPRSPCKPGARSRARRGLAVWRLRTSPSP